MIGHGKGLAILEGSLRAVGAVLLILYGAALMHRQVSSRLALREFDKTRSIAREHSQIPHESGDDQNLDFSLWSAKRVQAYRETRLVQRVSPVAVLRLEKLKIRVPVFEGTDELALNRGVGWIAGTARPGDTGNIGIAGHRDGFFRALKDIAPGDEIELSTTGGAAVYTVDRIQIVDPDNIDVLKSRGVPSLTLATCYPFYFLGDAPKRFIVQAAFKQQLNSKESYDGSASARANQIDRKEIKE